MGGVQVLDPAARARAVGGSVDVSRSERNGRVSSEWWGGLGDERYMAFDNLWANATGRAERSPIELPGRAPANAHHKHTSPAQQAHRKYAK
jgi:hypothetical protein